MPKQQQWAIPGGGCLTFTLLKEHVSLLMRERGKEGGTQREREREKGIFLFKKSGSKNAKMSHTDMRGCPFPIRVVPFVKFLQIEMRQRAWTPAFGGRQSPKQPQVKVEEGMGEDQEEERERERGDSHNSGPLSRMGRAGPGSDPLGRALLGINHPFFPGYKSVQLLPALGF